jgi:hypothetical protein
MEKQMYTIYCISMELKEMEMVIYPKQKSLLGYPNHKKDRDITDGSIYHVFLMHGKNLMVPTHP